MLAITNMTMPKGCDTCQFHHIIFHHIPIDDERKCLLTGKEYPFSQTCNMRSNDCPLRDLSVEQSEECVSKNSIKKAISEMLTWINSSNRGNADYFIVDKIEEIIKDLNIDEMPSIRSQHKNGKWIEKSAEDGCGERFSYWECSECGRTVGFNVANIKDILNDYPYCHCGAYMAGDWENTKDAEEKEEKILPATIIIPEGATNRDTLNAVFGKYFSIPTSLTDEWLDSSYQKDDDIVKDDKLSDI